MLSDGLALVMYLIKKPKLAGRLLHVKPNLDSVNALACRTLSHNRRSFNIHVQH